MKKYIVFATVLVLALAACDSSKTLDKAEETAKDEATAEKATEPKTDDESKVSEQELQWIPEQPADMEPIEVGYIPTEGFAARGAEEDEALVTIVEIGDYGCPDTEARRTLVEDVLDDYGNRVRYVYRNVVWVPGEYGPFAANLAAAAAQSGQYWKAYEIIWNRFRKLDEYSRESYLEPLGLTLKELKKAETFAKRIADQNQELATQKNVQWVPTYFVNGVPLVKVDDATFKRYVEVQIDKAQALRDDNPDLEGDKLYRALVAENAKNQKLPKQEDKEGGDKTGE